MMEQEVAVFPIPGVVSFPGQIIPLHIFEPRYRKMVKDCIRLQRPLCIALPKKIVSTTEESSKKQTVMEMLNTDQGTYEAFEIMGGGQIEIMEFTQDGRFIIHVHVTERYEVKEWVSSEEPYQIAKALKLDDEMYGIEEGVLLFDTLDQLCQDILGESYPMFQEQMDPVISIEKDISRFSFEIFKWCRLEPQTMQQILENTKPVDRTEKIIVTLEDYINQMTTH